MEWMSTQYSSLVIMKLILFTVSIVLCFCFAEYRGCMSRIVHQLCLMMPRTAAEEAQTITQDLIKRTPTSAGGAYN